MSELKLVSPLLDQMSVEEEIAGHNGCTCYALRHVQSGERFVVKRISVPASDLQVRALILSGGMAVLVEFLLNLTFGLHETFLWSFYPLAAGVVLGAMLLVIAMCKPLRRSLHRKFFI